MSQGHSGNTLRPACGKRRAMRRGRAGITLLELLIAMILSAVLTAAIGYAFGAGLQMRRLQAARSLNQDTVPAMERRITLMLTSAWLSSTTTDTRTFFIGTTAGQIPTSVGTTQGGATTSTSSTTSTTSGSGSSGGNETLNTDQMGCDTLVFTTTAPDIPLSVQENTTDDFPTQQQANGPIGSVAEVAYSTTPVGSPPANQTGLFERLQRPSDGDPSQGGMESLLSSEVDTIGFQFWDGQEWITTWDTTSGGAAMRRLPSAVLVSYTLKNSRDKKVQRFVVTIRTSNVTPENPVVGMGASTP